MNFHVFSKTDEISGLLCRAFIQLLKQLINTERCYQLRLAKHLRLISQNYSITARKFNQVYQTLAIKTYKLQPRI